MTHRLLCILRILSFACVIGMPALAQGDLASVVAEDLIAQHWNRTDAVLLAKAQEVSFALHEANGTLPDRIAMLARYAGDNDIQRAIADHPAYLDLFLALHEPRAFVGALTRSGRDWRGEEALLLISTQN